MAEPRVRILVVEDETLLRLGIVDVLSDAGFEVFEARSAAGAIKILTAGEGIRAMFTDVEMPGAMNGLSLAWTVRDRWPTIKIVITSGHVRIVTADIPAPGHFFSKPYNPESVARTLRALVGDA
ncbi:MAG TPA: response regulator [Arsenicitalea sp.]|jgi:CheY-like chemotaxis protein|nr:response regulator [Arsenicitalea sp.]